jgi:hypothetical protein
MGRALVGRARGRGLACSSLSAPSSGAAAARGAWRTWWRAGAPPLEMRYFAGRQTYAGSVVWCGGTADNRPKRCADSATYGAAYSEYSACDAGAAH